MNIVVLDGGTLNPGDLSWEPLRQLGVTTLYDSTAPDELVERCRDAGALLTNKVRLPRAAITALPNLRYIGVTATGHNIIDLAAASERGITVANVPAYGTRSVAQHAFALLLELTNAVGLHSESVRSGDWSRSPVWCYWKQPLVELDGRTAGLIGRGKIGDAFARFCEAAGMRVMSVSSRSSRAALLDLLAASDVLSLHCPLTDATRGLLNRETLALCKPTAFLINTARGPLIDEQALADALNAGRLAGAALDVLATEPPAPDNPLLTARNCLFTPHIAWASAAARRRLMEASVENLRAFLAGRPTNVVNG